MTGSLSTNTPQAHPARGGGRAPRERGVRDATPVDSRSPCEHCGVGRALVSVRPRRSDAARGIGWTLTLFSLLLIPFTADGVVYTFGLIEELRGPVEVWRWHLVALSPLAPLLTLVTCLPLLRRRAIVECGGCGVWRPREVIDRSVVPPFRPVTADRVVAERCLGCGCRALRKRTFGWTGLLRGFFGMLAVILGVLALNFGIPSVLGDLAAGAPPKFSPGSLTPAFLRVLVVPGALAALGGAWLLVSRWVPACVGCGAPRVRGS